MSGCDAFNLVNWDFVFEKEKEHMGGKLTEGAGLTRGGDRGTSSRWSQALAYQENIPRPTAASGFREVGAVLIFSRNASSSCRALSY